jgi:hypothetical protein
MGPDVFGTVTANLYNLIGTSSGSSGWQTDPAYAGWDQTNVSPGFGELTQVAAINGFRTYVVTLQDTSSANGNGNPNLPAGTTDQRGFIRAANTSIGAYDALATPPPPPPAGQRLGLVNPGNQGNLTGASVNLTITTNNPDDDPLVYAANDLPPGLSINNEGQISGKIAYDGASSSPYVVTVTVIDTATAESVRVKFDWTVTAHTVSLESIGNQITPEGSSVDLAVSASDNDGNLIYYLAFGLPQGLSINSSTGQIQGAIANSAANGSPYSVTVVAVDYLGHARASETFTWTVQQTPTITWSDPSAITFGTALSSTQLDATASVAGTFCQRLALWSLASRR